MNKKNYPLGRTRSLISKRVTNDSVDGIVDSVNSKTGNVVLDADDISDAGTTKKFATATEKSNSHVPLTVTDTPEIDLTLTAQDLSVAIKSSSIIADKLAAILDLTAKAVSLSIETGTAVNAAGASKVLTVSGVPADNDSISVMGQVYTFQNAIQPAGVKASSILTYSGVATNTETVTIDTTVYEYVTALTEAKGTATLTIANPVIDGETLTIYDRIYEIDEGGTVVDGNITVDISGGTKTQASETLTLTGVVIEGETFTIDTEVYEFDADGTVSGANIAVDVSAHMVQSEGTLTLGGAIPSNNETITVNSQVYTWKTTLTSAADEIKIGSTIDDCIDNYTYCINAGPTGEGVLFGTGTVANTAVTAAKGSGTTSVLTAIVYGVIGDLIDTTTTMGDGANIFDGAGTLGTTTAGVDCTAANADGVIISTFQGATVLAITASQGAGTTVDFDCDAAGALDGSASEGLATTLVMANGAFGAAAMTGATDATANEASAAIDTAITGDGGADVSSVDGTGSVAVTALVIGTVGNYVTSETMATGSWGGNLVGGLDAVLNEILVEVAVEDGINNLVAATNNTAGEGTKYSTGTIAHATVDVTKDSATELKAEFPTIGDVGNVIPIDESGGSLAWTDGDVFLAGGEGVETAYDVLIEATAELCIDNLVAAILGGAGEGSKYGTGTVTNTLITATKASPSTMDADAIVDGVDGNLIALAKSGANLSWAGGDAFLSGGSDGTVGAKNQILADATSLFFATAINTVADSNWKKLDWTSL